MKLLTILPFVGLVVSSSMFEQIPLGNEQYPGFDIDLNAQRLVQLEGQEPVWMSEWDKVCSVLLSLVLYSSSIS